MASSDNVFVERLPGKREWFRVTRDGHSTIASAAQLRGARIDIPEAASPRPEPDAAGSVKN